MSTEPKKFILNSSEELYADIRDRNFNAVGQVLSRKAKAISAQFEVNFLLAMDMEEESILLCNVIKKLQMKYLYS